MSSEQTIDAKCIKFPHMVPAIPNIAIQRCYVNVDRCLTEETTVVGGAYKSVSVRQKSGRRLNGIFGVDREPEVSVGSVLDLMKNRR